MPRTESEPGDTDDVAEEELPPVPVAEFTVTPLPSAAAAVAEERAWRALDNPSAARWLAAYYDTAGDYAGRTFLEALDGTAGMRGDEFTPADLFAVTLLQVDVAPRAARVFLEPGIEHNELVRRLVAVPPDEDLAAAGPNTLAAMAALYTGVKVTLGRDPWVTASKVCARKRPRLFPVRDRRVRELLDVHRYGDYTVDWQVFAHLMRQPAVIDRLADLGWQARQAGRTVQLDGYPLRHLDVLLWMDARDRGVGGARR